jgi:hypothetical protein
MIHPTVMFHTEETAPKGFRYLWAKAVKGFNPAKHCAQCLVGPYEKRFGLRMPVNDVVQLDGYAIGDLIYFCGVSAPYRWERNAHLAVRVTGDAFDSASIKLYTGAELTVTGAVAVPFTADKAAEAHPGRGKDYLTCRNFQFGAFVAEELPQG